jgi:asparagine synthase (glutamine-hydrolysing)
MKALRGLDSDLVERYLVYSSYYRWDELDRLLGHELRHDLVGHDPFRRHREHLERAPTENWLNRLLYLDLKTFLPCLNLAYTDKMSMAASTEVRVPLLDDELLTLTGRLPPSLKLKGLRRKYAFKRSLEPVLPRDVIWRRKAGFGAPIRAWLVGDLQPMLHDLLGPDAVRARGLFDPAEVARLIRANETGHEDNALRLWALLTLELWFRTFVDGDSAAVRSREAATERTLSVPATE